MRSRFRQVVILGPPLVIVLAAGSVLRTVPRALAGSLPVPGPVAACAASDGTLAAPTIITAGTWWTQRPELDGTGVLTGWTLTVGSPRAHTISTALPPASIVTGPDRGRVVATSDDGTRSTVRIIESPGRCARSLPLDGSVARRAILAPGGDEVIAQLLDRATRRDLGIWRLPLDGSDHVVLLPPVTEAVLRSVGIDRVWATDLRLSADGTRLAVQSCDPHACVTRVLDLRTNAMTTIHEAHGALIGFAGDRLITQAGCSGLPCDILAWDLATSRPTTIEGSAIGAAVSRDGHLVVAVRTSDGSAAASSINLGTGERRFLGPLDPSSLLQSGSGMSGIETLPDAIGLSHAGGPPAILSIDPSAIPEREAQP